MHKIINIGHRKVQERRSSGRSRIRVRNLTSASTGPTVATASCLVIAQCPRWAPEKVASNDVTLKVSHASSGMLKEDAEEKGRERRLLGRWAEDSEDEVEVENDYWLNSCLWDESADLRRRLRHG